MVVQIICCCEGKVICRLCEGTFGVGGVQMQVNGLCGGTRYSGVLDV